MINVKGEYNHAMIEARDQTDPRLDADWELNSNCAIVWPNLRLLASSFGQEINPLVRPLK